MGRIGGKGVKIRNTRCSLVDLTVNIGFYNTLLLRLVVTAAAPIPAILGHPC
jgi:hypothetical protein